MRRKWDRNQKHPGTTAAVLADARRQPTIWETRSLASRHNPRVTSCPLVGPGGRVRGARHRPCASSCPLVGPDGQRERYPRATSCPFVGPGGQRERYLRIAPPCPLVGPDGHAGGVGTGQGCPTGNRGNQGKNGTAPPPADWGGLGTSYGDFARADASERSRLPHLASSPACQV